MFVIRPGRMISSQIYHIILGECIRMLKNIASMAFSARLKRFVV